MSLNNSLKIFRKKYFDKLLEGQSKVVDILEKNFYSIIEKRISSFFPFLIRMPTGTGKTGIIAHSAYFGNFKKSCLILTPWKNLCDQLIDDLYFNFWDKICLSKKDKNKYIFKPVRMYPSKVGAQIQNSDSIVLVGTFAGLQNLQRNNIKTYKQLAKKVSLVIVDEGHYEPAVLWGKAVKDLNRPTLLLTATPYRNDLRLFLVPDKRVYHYSHYEAENTKSYPLRKLICTPLPYSSYQFTEIVDKFALKWKNNIKNNLHPKMPRAIICCKNKKHVKEALRIISGHNISALAFHEREDVDDFKDNLKLKNKFKKTVPSAKGKNEEIWIHQNKLTEGLDDPRFCTLLITYNITNHRKLIQQIGRILRHSTKDLKKKNIHRQQQNALIFYPKDFPLKEIWNSYLKYEKNQKLVTGEYYRNVVLKFLNLNPEYEYFGRKFRKRLSPFELISKKKSRNYKISTHVEKKIIKEFKKEARTSILTPPSVKIFKVNKKFK